MSGLAILLWVLNASLDTLGQVAFKFAATIPDPEKSIKDYWLNLFRQPWLWVGIFAYIFEFLLWLAFLTLVPLSLGVLLAAVNIITVMVVGRILFNEKLTPTRVAGILLITGGVVLVGIS